MPLSWRERLTMLVPPSVFYRRRIAQEARTGEPELAVLAELVPRGGIAVDVGANVGFFAYALADIADRVVAFEPNPDYALRNSRDLKQSCSSFGRGFGVRLTVSFQNSRDYALVAPIPKGHQARLYHRRANTSPIDSNQLRTFSDNVPHSKKTRLRTQRKRTTEWVMDEVSSFVRLSLPLH